MGNYRGETTDKIVNGGSYVSEMKTGHEDQSFLEFDGKYYGDVRNRGSSFDLERISGNDNIKKSHILMTLILFDARLVLVMGTLSLV